MTTRRMRSLHAAVLCVLMGLAGCATTSDGDADDEESSASEAASPLASCYAGVATRDSAGECLRRRLAKAEERLAGVYAAAEQVALQLDDVRDGRANNHRALVESHNRWKAYITAECDRVAEALRPGTGSGDALLDCRVRLTERRVQDVKGGS